MKTPEERRWHPRIRVTDDDPICCCITPVDSGDGDCDSAIYDVSRTGFCLLTDQPYSEGTDLRLDIRFGETLLKGVHAFVVHARNDGDRGWQLGVSLHFREGSMRLADTFNGMISLLEQLQGKANQAATA